MGGGRRQGVGVQGDLQQHGQDEQQEVVSPSVRVTGEVSVDMCVVGVVTVEGCRCCGGGRGTRAKP